MNLRTFQTSLREELANLDTTLGFHGSLAALDTAFNRRLESPLIQLTQGDDDDFFGRATLSKLYGPEFDEVLPDHEYYRGGRDRNERFGLRRKAYQYVVVGFREDVPEPHSGRTARVPLAAAVLLTDTRELTFFESDWAASNEVAMLRLRAGLMNRVQATLLASHLNRFRRDVRHREVLRWQVLKGPAVDSRARAWLDGIPCAGPFLRRDLGELSCWCLGERATESIAMFRLDMGTVLSGEQVFACASPTRTPPPRYEIVGRPPKGKQALPDHLVMDIRRALPCPDALALTSYISECGLLQNGYNYYDPYTNWGRWVGQQASTGTTSTSRGVYDFFGAYQDGVPPCGEVAHTAAMAYSLALSRCEAIAALPLLRDLGFEGLQLSRIGNNGIYYEAAYSLTGDHRCVDLISRFTIPTSPPLELESSGQYWTDE